MKYIVFICYFLIFSNISFARETCVKNDKGVFCGVEVLVHESGDSAKNKKVECIDFNGKKVCGYDCKKNLFGADCKKHQDEMCIESIKGVICGYNCEQSGLISACSSRQMYTCFRHVDKIKCGVNCRFGAYGLMCDEEDTNSKFMK
ncbi:hypothetical protein [Silvanigrella aquatica]|uniref:Uncharacterized protein n=1 Tax=Silvanigrella aquatica TaxID=1915309 RepID=A0A1L4D1N8_9BACT|nr:hypothetical protein [Silvanigrella aquatica]APJ04112.1 hypothetical protein AXG55_09410 [Silvanigrella aquatica]